MKLLHTFLRRGKFEVLAATPSLQAAMMTLKPGGASDEELGNEHPNSEQWLFVIAGNGLATMVPRREGRRTIRLRAGSLLVIQRGELHQIKVGGRQPLRTINFYAPPAYRLDGELRS